ncbi:MAG TPA: hypothetical protein VL147_10415 [Devosia sp.]|nr:hypothetical protein [Devosia sp.]
MASVAGPVLAQAISGGVYPSDSLGSLGTAVSQAGVVTVAGTTSITAGSASITLIDVGNDSRER